MRSIACNPQLVAECNPPQVVYNQSEGRNIQSLRFDNIQFARRTDYILAYARLHTNPSDWIKNKTVRRLSYFLGPTLKMEPVEKPDFL